MRRIGRLSGPWFFLLCGAGFIVSFIVLEVRHNDELYTIASLIMALVCLSQYQIQRLENLVEKMQVSQQEKALAKEGN